MSGVASLNQVPMFTAMRDMRKYTDYLQDQGYTLQAVLRQWPDDSPARTRSVNIDFNYAMNQALSSGCAVEVLSHALGEDLYVKLNTDAVVDLSPLIERPIVIHMNTVVKNKVFETRACITADMLKIKGTDFLEDIFRDTYTNLLMELNKEKYRAR